MDIILYNPKSRNGYRERFIEHVKKTLKNKHHAVVKKNILDIDNVDAFLQDLNEDDRIILIGGDGTIHRLVNTIDMSKIKQSIWMVRGGTGNDFLRSLNKKDLLVPIQKHLKRLPTVQIGNQTLSFINGVGIGLDGLVGMYIENEFKKKTKLSFLKATLKAFWKHKPNEMRFRFHDHEVTHQRVWMASVMYGSTFGGGMKIAPLAKRDEHLYLVIIKDCPKWLLFFIFPLIYIGKHTWFKAYVDIHQVNKVEIRSILAVHGEVDGELLKDIKVLNIKR